MIRVHRSERADHLVGALGDLLLDPLDDPMAAEVVAVPTRGVERWLTQRLSHRLGTSRGADGVCANITFPFPGSMVGKATSTACGFDPGTDPWAPELAVWPLLDLVDELLGEPWLEPLEVHLKAGSPKSSDGPVELRRFAIVRHLADLYDRYAVHRPAMIQGWAEGIGGGRADNGPDEVHWQCQLWRRLRHRIDVPSPAERLASAVVRLEDEPTLLELPRRLSLFGMTRIPASYLQILAAIAANREVHLYLLHPSGALWDAVAKECEKAPLVSLARSADPTAGFAEHPLLRSWGRDAREMQLVLRARGLTEGEHLAVPEVPTERRTLLEHLQADIRADCRPVGVPRASTECDARPLLDPADDSLRVHSCHGRLRQVEVVRDAVLHLLAEDPTLEPRDVIVMCPDIESYAPLIHAVFGSGPHLAGPGARGEGTEPDPGPPQLRVRLADRSIRQTNPVMAVAGRLLDLAGGRVPASEVLDLAGSEPVARRFGFDDEALTQIERWVAGSGIRWGIDQEHRQTWNLGHVGDNSWEAGMDRLLLGVAMADEDQRLFGGVLPVDDMSSGDVDLAGRFAEFVERLKVAVEGLASRHTVAEWVAVLAGATESLCLAAPREQWQLDQLQRVLADLLETARSNALGEEGPGGASDALLDLAEARSVLDDCLRGRPTRANFRTGDLTVCTLVPMRSVPHRVIGLLGLDDGAFPRPSPHDGDDLLSAEPHIGDRDARSEDRQLLLDALLAATEHLIVTYEGRDTRMNHRRSPCVPVAELLDVIDRTVRSPDGALPARSHVVVEHPLQSFDWRNFSPGQVVGDDPWGFDPVDLDGARSRTGPREERPPFLASPLERVDTQVVQLERLVQFLENPVRVFLRERLGWYGSAAGRLLKDAFPVELDALEQWDVGERMLEALLSGAAPAEIEEAEQARGLLPPGALAAVPLQRIETEARALAAAVSEHIGSEGATPGSMEVRLRLHDGRALVGTVPDVYEATRPDGAREARIVRSTYSRLNPKHRIAAWARFLALTAARPEIEVSAVTIGRGQGTRPVAMSTLVVVEGNPDERRRAALDQLAVLVDLYDRGLCEPLPLYAKTSEKFVAATRRGDDVLAKCRTTWVDNDHTFGDEGQAEHRLVLGDTVTIEDVFAESPRSDESGPGWSKERSRFGRLARRLWEPVFDHEQRGQAS